MLAIDQDILQSRLDQAVIKKRISRLVNNRREKLRKFLFELKKESPPNSTYIEYVERLHLDFDKIIFAKSDEFGQLVAVFERIIKSTEFKNDDETRAFKDNLLNKMDYTGMRNCIYPEIYGQLGIKTCVFCNAQLAIVVSKDGTDHRARFEMDHYWPKSKYPYFSISFYNLYPACSSCNGGKSNDKVDFKLYVPAADLPKVRAEQKNDFKFELNPTSLAKYLLDHKQGNLKIGFPQGEFERAFSIESIYNTQKDVAEELIHKSQVYTESMKKSLIASFNKLYGKQGIGEQIIVGNYTNTEDIHKRPLAKFTQDIARQLGLIK